MGNNRYCVIMAGGVGSRFWPFSRADRPKQFLDLFGMGRSLLQMTYDRFSAIVPPEHVFISTHEQYVDLVMEQLPQLPRERILAESQRRNTAPCVAWAAYHVRAIDPEATMIVSPSDHVILREEVFSEAIRQGMDFVESHPSLLTLGVKPTRLPRNPIASWHRSLSTAGSFSGIRASSFGRLRRSSMPSVNICPRFRCVSKLVPTVSAITKANLWCRNNWLPAPISLSTSA